MFLQTFALYQQQIQFYNLKDYKNRVHLCGVLSISKYTIDPNRDFYTVYVRNVLQNSCL